MRQPTAPDPDKVAIWQRIYREHRRHPTEPGRCAAKGCYGRFPCFDRMETAELLIVAGVGVPDRSTTDQGPRPAAGTTVRR